VIIIPSRDRLPRDKLHPG